MPCIHGHENLIIHRLRSQNPSSSPSFFLSSFVCLYTNKYNILCVFYVILFFLLLLFWFCCCMLLCSFFFYYFFFLLLKLAHYRNIYYITFNNNNNNIQFVYIPRVFLSLSTIHPSLLYLKQKFYIFQFKK